jgi:hypothetical protein
MAVLFGPLALRAARSVWGLGSGCGPIALTVTPLSVVETFTTCQPTLLAQLFATVVTSLFDTEVWPTLTLTTRQPGDDIFHIGGVRHLLRFELVALAIGVALRAPLTARGSSCLSSASSRSTRGTSPSTRRSISRQAR